MILVGNKVDLPREVSKEEGKKMADSHKIKYFETSAKDNVGINESMQALIHDVVIDKKPKVETISLDDTNSKSGGCKC